MTRKVKTEADLCRCCVTRARSDRGWFCDGCWKLVPKVDVALRVGADETAKWVLYLRHRNVSEPEQQIAVRAHWAWFDALRDAMRERLVAGAEETT